ncbi:MAG TPA: SDR family NAD(P)-dependent oxidoreductase [Ktedonobacterales bacterium]
MLTLPLARLFDLSGQVALVTGAGRGIGAAIALRLAEAGAAVLLADSDLETARATAERIVDAGGRAAAVRADVARAREGRAAVAAAVATFGRLDILINNAGIFPFAAALHLREAAWDRVLATNLKGAFFCAQAAARQMLAQGGGGRIVNITSTAALRPSGNLAHYDASKGGLIALTRSLAREFAQYAIAVNAIAPGEIDTPGTRAAAPTLDQRGGVVVDDMAAPQFLARIPLGRLGQPDDVARVALFLASAAADYMTGSVVVVDGGFLLT